MAKGWNNGIVGTCVNTLLNNNVRLHRTVTSHVVMNSPTGVGFDSGTFACGRNAPFTAELGTRIIPDMYTFPNGSVFRAQGYYGQTSSPVQLVTYGDDPVFFCEDDLVWWRKRDLYQPNLYRMYASGPALQSSHAWQALQRKPAYANTYLDRFNYSFLDAASPIKPTTTSTTTPEPGPGTTTTPAPEPPPCQLNDWMVFQHPASPLWTNLTEPFVATKWYEQSGQMPVRASQLGGENFMPFCNPLPARRQDGEVLGSYVGYGFSLMFGQNTNAFPVRPYLPRDPNSPLPNPPFVQPTNAFYGVEMLVYIISDTDALASPCIGRKRWWMYSNAGQSGGFTWFDPYFAILFGSMNSMWMFDVVFPYYQGGSESIKFNLSDLTVLVAA